MILRPVLTGQHVRGGIPVEEVAGGSVTVSVRAEDEGAVGRAGAWGRPAPSRNLSRGADLLARTHQPDPLGQRHGTR